MIRSARELLSSKHPVVFVSGGIGHQQICWPTIRALSTLFEGRLKLVLSRGLPDCFYRDVSFRDAITIDWDPSDAVGHQTAAARVGPCDLFISLSTWYNDGFRQFWRSLAPKATVAVDLDRDSNLHDQVFRVAQHFEPGLRMEDFAAPPRFSPFAEHSARACVDLMNPEGFGPCKLLFVHPETKPAKQWVRAEWTYVLTAFLRSHREYRVFVASTDDLDLRARSPERVNCGRLSLETSLAMVQYADLFIGVDSCFLRAADHYRVPSIGLFGPTDPKLRGFRFAERHLEIRAPGFLSSLSRETVLRGMERLANSSGTTYESSNSSLDESEGTTRAGVLHHV